MNHTIPFRFLAAILTICLCILCMCRPLSAKSSLSSAQKIPVGSKKKITIAAYDTEYFYFQIPTTYQNKEIGITLSGNATGLLLSALDSSGTSLSLKRRNSIYELSGILSADDRCFLCIQNSLSKEQTATLTISCIQQKAEIANPRTTPGKKESLSGKANVLTGKSTKRKSPAKKSANSDKKKTDTKTSHRSQSNRNDSYQNRTSVPTSNQPTVTRKRAKKKASKTHNPPTASPITALPSLKTHFLRLRQGTSLFLAERLFDRVPNLNITVTPSSPSVSVNNGIIYVPKDGLYYLTITYGNNHTTCTILVTTND